MELNKITSEDLKVQIHHVGGIGNCGPTEALMGLNKFAYWTFYDADSNALNTMTNCEKKDFTIINKCLNNYDGQGEFNVTITPSASSLLKPAKSASNYIHINEKTTWGEQTKILKTEKIEVHKLDTLLSKGQIPPIDFLSVDAQGADLNIIKGTDLSLVMAVMCEVEYTQLYEGQPLIFDVHKYMHDNDFRFCLLYNPQMMNVRPYVIGTGFMTVGEAFFLKDPTNLINKLKDMPIDERTKTVVQLLKLSAISSCYNQNDYTMNVLEELHKVISIEKIERECKDSYLGILLNIFHKIRKYEKILKE